MSAEKFVMSCQAAGLICISQETVNWGQAEMNDCFSLFTLPGSHWRKPYILLENAQYMLEAEMLRNRSSLYYYVDRTITPPAARI